MFNEVNVSLWSSLWTWCNTSYFNFQCVFTGAMNETVVRYFPRIVTLDVSDIALDYGGQVILSVFTFIMCISIPLNAVIIAACFYRRFNSPMLLYIALSSLADTSWGVVVISCFFSRIIARRKIISFHECLFQLFSIHCTVFQQSLTTWLMYV